MPEVEDGSPLVGDDPSQRCSKALRTILHGVLVTTLFTVIMFAYIYLYRSSSYDVASLVIQLIAYLALGCLYICNSSGWQEKVISAGFLVFVQLVFLVCPIGIPGNNSLRVDFVSGGTNIVAISSYCVWKFHHFIILHCTRTILLHGLIVAILLFVIIITYVLQDYQEIAIWLVVQLVSYNAVCCLHVCNASGRKEKAISAGFLILGLLVFLLSSFDNINLRPSLIFAANIVAISSYCLLKLYPWLRRHLLHAPDAAVAPPRQPSPQDEAVLELQQSPFRIECAPKEFSSDEIQSITQDFGNRIGHGDGAVAPLPKSFVGASTTAWPSPSSGYICTVATPRPARKNSEERSPSSPTCTTAVVRLLGYCLQRRGGLYLVYPFYQNGSLDRWLFHGSEEQRRLLTWPKRRCVAVDVARALTYLHNECCRRILHLDIKPGNILLDGDLRALDSDFGISLSITRDLTSVINTRGRGTFGYMAPEMLVNAVSNRSDVFSYGMTLLELIGGRRQNFNPSSSATPDANITRILQKKMAQGEHMDLVDAAMVDVDEEAVKTVVKVALCCIQHERDMRPSMQNEGRIAVNIPPEARRQSSSAVNL